LSQRPPQGDDGGLRAGELRLLAAALEWVVSDVDGVLTDGRLFYGPDGEAWKTFHVRDGLAFKLAQRAGLKVGVISARGGPALERRAQELGIDAVITRREDKGTAFRELLEETGTRAEHVAYVGDDLAYLRDQCRWFGGMVGNHVADLVERYGDDSAVPAALTDYIKNRQGYDYNQHGSASSEHVDFVPDEVIDRFCILGPVEAHLDRLAELKTLGVEQFAIYLQHDGKDHTLAEYGEKIIPAITEQELAKR